MSTQKTGPKAGRPGGPSVDIRKGLNGVVVDSTAISKVVAETNSLTYRGYPVQSLCAMKEFEDVAFLLWNGELPNDAERNAFCQAERAARHVDRSLLDLIASMPKSAHPMDVVRTATSWLGARDPGEDDPAPGAQQQLALRLFAQLPTIVAWDIRRRKGLDFIPPDYYRPYSENFLHMCFGGDPDVADVRAFDTSMVLYAEHSFNASTFAARVVTSTTADLYSAVTAAIGALKGRLHGGANEAVMEHMLEIGDPRNAHSWINERLDSKQKVIGFGHRVYKHGDSRVPTMDRAFRDIAAVKGNEHWIRMYDEMATAMAERTGIAPNLDFPSGPAYHLLGFDTEFFTPLFVMSRVVGWTAHIVEQSQSNALIRPLSAYDGVAQREVSP